MARKKSEIDFRGSWSRLQALGLNAYEARSYMVLLGHPRFKALELAARAEVPRQKIYEVLDSLLEKGFASVIQDKTKLFSAVPPDQALPAYFARRKQALEEQLAAQNAAGDVLIAELMTAYAKGQGSEGSLDVLRVVHDPAQTAVQFRKMLAAASKSYIEFSRPPYAVDPVRDGVGRNTSSTDGPPDQVIEAARRGVACRVLVEEGKLTAAHHELLDSYSVAGIEVRRIAKVPMKLALVDARSGMLALVDPVSTNPMWTAIAFEHEGMAEAMASVFEDHWRRAKQ